MNPNESKYESLIEDKVVKKRAHQNERIFFVFQ